MNAESFLDRCSLNNDQRWVADVEMYTGCSVCGARLLEYAEPVSGIRETVLPGVSVITIVGTDVSMVLCPGCRNR